MKKYIFGNFKMNMDIKEIENYFDTFLPLVTGSKNEIVIFPSFVSLMFAYQKTTSKKVLIGAQNVGAETLTGEVSAKMLKSVGAKYVIVGHSDRRKHFYEKNELINKKIKLALSEGLKVVLCVGETKYEKSNGKLKQVIQKDLQEALKGLYENELKNIIIAYEPVWSIGTGKMPTNKEIGIAIKTIKQEIASEFSPLATNNIKIVYGGSVTNENARTILNIKDIDGLLVGAESLNPEKFAKICNLE